MFDFPSSPTIGAVYSASGVSWQWDGEKWKGGLGLTEAPSDGGEYVRVNGVWRKKSQTFSLVGASFATGVSIPVPTGAKMLKYRAFALMTAAVAFYFTARLSVDGTTYVSGSEYSNSGVYFSSALTSVTNLPAAAATSFMLSITTNGANCGNKVEGFVVLQRATSGGMFDGEVRGSAYQSGGHYQSLISNYVIGATAGFGASALAIKGVQFASHASGAGNYTDGFVDAEWVY